MYTDDLYNELNEYLNKESTSNNIDILSAPMDVSCTNPFASSESVPSDISYRGMEMSVSQIEDLKEYLYIQKSVTFARKLDTLLTKRNMNCNQLSMKINISRQALSKIFNYKKPTIPKKLTIIKICLALKLNLKDTEELLKLGEYCFNDCSEFDRFLMFCIDHGIYEYEEVYEFALNVKSKLNLDYTKTLEEEAWY